MNNKSIFDGFKFSEKFESSAFFDNKGPFKNSEINKVVICVGQSSYNQFLIYSNPLGLEYNLSEYKNLGIYICSDPHKLLEISKIKLNLYKDIEKYNQEPNYCFWSFVPTELVQSLLKEIIDYKETKEEYGCYCKVCGLYDEYAIAKNGKGLCYKHMKF